MAGDKMGKKKTILLQSDENGICTVDFFFAYRLKTFTVQNFEVLHP